MNKFKKKKDESSEIRGKKQSILILNKEASLNVRGTWNFQRYKVQEIFRDRIKCGMRRKPMD